MKRFVFAFAFVVLYFTLPSQASANAPVAEQSTIQGAVGELSLLATAQSVDRCKRFTLRGRFSGGRVASAARAVVQRITHPFAGRRGHGSGSPAGTPPAAVIPAKGKGK